jgi:Rhodopirellula transposase DDE domain/WD domain, G-beta repeat
LATRWASAQRRLCRARKGSVGAFIEDKNSGTILLQQAWRRQLLAHAIDSKLTAMGKDERAISVSGYVHRGLVKPAGRVRRKGGGRRAISDKDPQMREELRRLVEPARLGDPMRPLIWVSKSLAKLASALTAMGHRVSPETVRVELLKLGFSRQGNRKAEEGSRHPDRNAQFEYINATVVSAQRRGTPVVSVDTKKKELVGNYKNGGTDYRRKGDPLRVNVHDFEDKTLGKVAPYGVYDVTANEGWVSVGITADPLNGHKGTVRSAAFSADGKHIVTASDDHTARLWASRPASGSASRSQAIRQL